MGLSSSQARLLSLTGRMHQIEYKAQKLEAQKLQLANESRRVYLDYMNALEQTKVQYKILNTDGSTTFVDATYNNFIGTRANDHSIYILRDIDSGKAYVPNVIRSAYENSDRTIDGFLKTLNSLKSDESASYTPITSAEELMNIAGSNGNFKLDSDIVVENWEGISNFSGTLDGNGHTITIKSGTNGLFQKTDGATLRNLEVSMDVNGAKNIGGLVGIMTNTDVENCSVRGNLLGDKFLGGLAGNALGNCVIKNCAVDVDVTSKFKSDNNTKNDHLIYAGGFIGRGYTGCNLTIEGCRSDGDVAAEYQVIGGFIGILMGNANIKNCVETGDITADKTGLSQYYNYAALNSSIQPSGTFIGEAHNDAVVNIENSYAYGMPTNEGKTAAAKYTDFGTAFRTSVINTTNSYSALNNGISNETIYPSVNSADIDLSGFPNLSNSDINYYTDMFNILNQSGGGISVDENQANNPEWLANVLTGGFAIIGIADVVNSALDIIDTSVAVDTNLQEIEDKSKIRKAEAKYEADMRRIDMKDRKYDYDLSAIEAERNAIKQEMETIKTVAKDNVERTFKLFS